MTHPRTDTTSQTTVRYDAGDVLIVMFPFTDGSGQKPRPALVVSAAKFNLGEDFVIVPISSQIRQGDPFQYIIQDSDPWFKQTGLRCSSSIKWTKPLTITDAVVDRKLGTLPPPPLTEVLTKIRGIFQLPPTPKPVIAKPPTGGDRPAY